MRPDTEQNLKGNFADITFFWRMVSIAPSHREIPMHPRDQLATVT